MCTKSIIVWLLMVGNKVCSSVDTMLTFRCSSVFLLLRNVAVSLGTYAFEIKCIHIFVLVVQSAAFILILFRRALIFNCVLLLLV